MPLMCMGVVVANSNALKCFLIASMVLTISVEELSAKETSIPSVVIQDVLTNFDVCNSLGIEPNAEEAKAIQTLQREKQLLEFALDGSKKIAAEERSKFAQCETEKRSIQNELRMQIDGNKNDEKLQGYIDTTKALRSEIRELKKEISALKSEKKMPTTINYSKILIDYKKQVQSLLNEKNCPAGKVDGIIGKKTIDAAQWFARSVKYYSFNGDIFDELFYEKLNSSEIRCQSVAKKNNVKVSDRNRAELNGRWSLTATCDGGRVITATGNMKYLRNDATTVRYDLTNYVNSLGSKGVGTALHYDFGTANESIDATIWFEGGGKANARLKRINTNLLKGTDSSGCSLVASR